MLIKIRLAIINYPIGNTCVPLNSVAFLSVGKYPSINADSDYLHVSLHDSILDLRPFSSYGAFRECPMPETLFVLPPLSAIGLCGTPALALR